MSNFISATVICSPLPGAIITINQSIQRLRKVQTGYCWHRLFDAMLRSMLCLGFLIPICSLVSSDLHSAFSDLESLPHAEGIALTKLNFYIQEQEKRLDELRWRMTNLYREHSKATSNVKEHLSNPVNVFLIIKRLTVEWTIIEGITKDIAQQMLLNKTSKMFPTENDLVGAVDVVVRLQDMYNLDTEVVANGMYTGSKMWAEDCYIVGQKLYDNGDMHRAAKWMLEAYKRFGHGMISSNAKLYTLDFLAYYTSMTGNMEDSLKYISQVLQLDPGYENARFRRDFYEDEVWHSREQLVQNITSYRELCQGKTLRNASEISNLKCRYISNGSSFLKIAPFKMEEMNLQPRIVVFHDVLSDAEIKTLKDLAKPRLKRATVATYEKGVYIFSNKRISQSAWLTDDEHPTVGTVIKRVEDMSGLSVETAEDLHIVNYGLGGQYDPHFDFSHGGELSVGNRIATVMFWMSDVSFGGLTAFPRLGVALKAKKGSAAFWYNLHTSGDKDSATLHAGCPVLIGEKWIANLWLHEQAQEFRRKCDPEDYETNVLPNLEEWHF